MKKLLDLCSTCRNVRYTCMHPRWDNLIICRLMKERLYGNDDGHGKMCLHIYDP